MIDLTNLRRKYDILYMFIWVHYIYSLLNIYHDIATNSLTLGGGSYYIMSILIIFAFTFASLDTDIPSTCMSSDLNQLPIDPDSTICGKTYFDFSDDRLFAINIGKPILYPNAKITIPNGTNIMLDSSPDVMIKIVSGKSDKTFRTQHQYQIKKTHEPLQMTSVQNISLLEHTQVSLHPGTRYMLYINNNLLKYHNTPIIYTIPQHTFLHGRIISGESKNLLRKSKNETD